ncbi:MAG: hypothetical protein ACYTG7_24105 [Planctomycetota bacterium]|jgi:hypothetical protein
MPIEGIGNLQNTYANEAARNGFTVQAPNKKKGRSRENTGTDLARAVTSVDLTDAGKEMVAIDELLERIEEPELRNKARKGMDRVMRKVVEKEGKEGLRKLFAELRALEKEDRSKFERIVSKLGDLTEEELENMSLRELTSRNPASWHDL